MLTRDAVMQVMSKVTHPEIDYSLVDLGMIKDVSTEEDRMTIILNLPSLEVPVRDLLARLVKEAVAHVDATSQAEVQFAEMSEQERREFMRKAREKWKS